MVVVVVVVVVVTAVVVVVTTGSEVSYLGSDVGVCDENADITAPIEAYSLEDTTSRNPCVLIEPSAFLHALWKSVPIAGALTLLKSLSVGPLTLSPALLLATAVVPLTLQYLPLFENTLFVMFPLNLSLEHFPGPTYERRFLNVPAVHLSSWKFALPPPIEFEYDVQLVSEPNLGLLLSVKPWWRFSNATQFSST